VDRSRKANLPENVDPTESEDWKILKTRNAHGSHLRARPVDADGAYRAADPGLERRNPPTTAGRARNGSTRRGKIFLVPGDSPVGFRLPLGALPYGFTRSELSLCATHSDPSEDKPEPLPDFANNWPQRYNDGLVVQAEAMPIARTRDRTGPQRDRRVLCAQP
jgi:uncharacterized protein (DUF2126 family)